MRHFTIIQSLLDKNFVNEQIELAIKDGKELLKDFETGEYAPAGGTENAIKKADDFIKELRGIAENHGAMQMEHLKTLMENAQAEVPVVTPVEVPEFELTEEHTPEEMKMDEASEKGFEKGEEEVKKKKAKK